MARIIALSVFRSFHQSSTLFDFQLSYNEDQFIFDETTLIYVEKHRSNPNRKKVKAATKKEAMDGKMPGYDYEMVFQLTLHRDNNMNKTQYQLSPSPNLLNQKEPNILKQKPYICLSRMGRRDDFSSYEIIVGDIIKLGDIEFEIIETHLSKYSKSQPLEQIIMPVSLQKEQRSNFKKTCKICLAEGQKNDDMISPCNCKGSCQFVHLNCLQIWISSKIKKRKSNLVTTNFIQKMQCEICKKKLPSKIQVKGKINSLIQFNQPNQPYIVIQRLNSKGTGQTFYVMKANGKDIKIGADQQMNLRFNNLTISDTHSSISFKDGKFYLNDEGSQFGSLILLTKAVKIQRIMCVQIGVKVLKFEPFRTLIKK